MGTMAFSPGGKPPAAVVDSRLSPYAIDGARVVVAVAPRELKDGFRKTYAEVKTAWAAALEQGLRNKAEKGTNEKSN
jgi:hypothetical protein